MEIIRLIVFVAFVVVNLGIGAMVDQLGDRIRKASKRSILDSLSSRLKVPVYLDEIPREAGLYDRRGTKHYVFKYTDMQCFVIIESNSEESVRELFWKELHLRIPNECSQL